MFDGNRRLLRPAVAQRSLKVDKTLDANAARCVDDIYCASHVGGSVLAPILWVVIGSGAVDDVSWLEPRKTLIDQATVDNGSFDQAEPGQFGQHLAPPSREIINYQDLVPPRQ